MTEASQEGDKDRLIEELRREIAARDEFIAVAAHELRNPMTPIVALVQLLLTRAHREDGFTRTPVWIADAGIRSRSLCSSCDDVARDHPR